MARAAPLACLHGFTPIQRELLLVLFAHRARLWSALQYLLDLDEETFRCEKSLGRAGSRLAWLGLAQRRRVHGYREIRLTAKGRATAVAIIRTLAVDSAEVTRRGVRGDELPPLRLALQHDWSELRPGESACWRCGTCRVHRRHVSGAWVPAFYSVEGTRLEIEPSCSVRPFKEVDVGDARMTMAEVR